MCGIAGWLGALANPEESADRIARALHHRGPDARGIRSWPEATLVHARLSIIDLSPAGAQPMANEDGTVWTVLNGEIFNHHELRRSLEARGHVFRGRSDTEVIPHLYEDEGPGFVSKLRGMFALAVYDTRARTLLLARDRFGIKPLFYAPGPHRLGFASELSALKVLPDVDHRPDPQAISDYAALFFVPAPATFYRGMRSLQPGELLVARLNGDDVPIELSPYHQWAIAPDTSLTAAQAEEETAELLIAAVRSQLESDVPLGALLSGGIDSSLVSSAAQASLRDPLRTFNVRFAEQGYDESWAAEAVAHHIGSRHETLAMDDMPGTWNHIVDILRHAGQPFADTSIFAVHAVCKLMRRHVTVALSGDGGDEGFGGYDVHRRLAAMALWRRLPPSFGYGISTAMAPLERLGLVPDRLPQRLKELAAADGTGILQNLWSWIREPEHRRLCRGLDVHPVRRLFDRQWEHDLPPGASGLESLSAHATEVQTRLILPNDFLFKVDIASMRESLEVRVPMLDEDLFAFALSLPHRLKVKHRTGKRILRGVARKWLPPAVAGMPKHGFEIPVDRWVEDDFKVNLRETLLATSGPLPEFFRPEAYRPMVEAFCDGRPYPGVSREGLYQRAIMFLSLHLFLRS